MQIARRHPYFGRLLAALAASQLGDWLYNLAPLAYVQERTHSTAWLGLTTAAGSRHWCSAGQSAV